MSSLLEKNPSIISMVPDAVNQLLMFLIDQYLRERGRQLLHIPLGSVLLQQVEKPLLHHWLLT